MSAEERLRAIMAALLLLCLVNGAELVMLWEVMCA